MFYEFLVFEFDLIYFILFNTFKKQSSVDRLKTVNDAIGGLVRRKTKWYKTICFAKTFGQIRIPAYYSILRVFTEHLK